MDLITEEHVLSISRRMLFEEWSNKGKNDRNSHLYECILAKYELKDLTEESQRRLKNVLTSFSSKLNTKWNSAARSMEQFVGKFKSWLDGQNIEITVHTTRPQASASCDNINLVGRPKLDFESSSFKTKKRRVEDLVQSRSVGELLTAAEVTSRSAGNRNTAKVIKNINESPNTSSSSLDHSSSVKSRQLTGDEALAYYIDSKSTTHTYKMTRKWSMKAGHYEYPSYHCLRKAKLECYPAEEHIHVTENRVEINLQALLDKTAERLVQSQREVIGNLPSSTSLRLISKWGCDESSGHSTYKQKFTDNASTDQYLFVFSFVPLRLLDDENKVIWQNPRPSSTMYCRPIKFIFAKETTELTTVGTNKVLDQINNLLPSICTVDSSQFSVNHKLSLTMTDGKVCNALSNHRSTQSCFICHATPTQMNGDADGFDPNEENYGFGLSTLHAWIRCFECFLHISYKLDIKKWKATSNDEKASVKLRSEHIRRRFKEEMGLIVDQPKPGFGSTNDGNTARRFLGILN
ncbi:uncharacterized protein LOC125241277 [Leguminivora glycinivorella]|uniref:uncharacterized protein LOC125241277 n=1 Tax=Leguminivora glycinivorella TaxID=1035111 RepID=UPI00200E24A2|nr:uncharacterized protein LOC125241277 [Leguminivora glycinivorella]